MLQHLLPLLAREHETTGNAIRVVMNSGQVIICLREELADKLPGTPEGLEMLASLQLEVKRFGRKSTVAHLLHVASDTAFIGVSICENPNQFSKKSGQDLAIRDAARQFLTYEVYRRKCPVLVSQTHELTS